MPGHAFISYSRKDSAFVDQLEAELNRRGIATWRDKHNIPGGMAWYQAIVTGLDQAYAMICVVSPNADESRWVLREQLYGDQRQIPRVPVLMQPHRIPFHLIEAQPIDCGTAKLTIGIGQLVALLEPLQTAAETAPTVAAPIPVEPEAPLDTDRLRTEYLNFLLSETVADLRDALYINLHASTEPAAPEPKRTPTNPLAAGLGGAGFEMLFDLKQLGLETIKGDDFDRRGDEVDDARQPIREYQRVVLLGEPGAGKTTTLLKLVVDFARTAQTDPAAPLPVFLPLREFNGAQTFADFVRQKLGILQDAADAFPRFYLLDALNEMPRTAVSDGRDLVAEVRDFLRGQTDWVVSCRVRDYQDDLTGLPQVGKVRIKPLDPPQIRDFISRFYANTPDLLDRSLSAKLWAEMKGSDTLLAVWQTLVNAQTPDAFWGTAYPSGIGSEWREMGQAWQAMRNDPRRMLPLCRNPYLLTMICRLYSLAGQLPPNRGVLFKQFVDVLLHREAASARQTGAAWLADTLIRRGLAAIAYALGSQTEMPRLDAEAILATHLPDVDSGLLLRLAASASLIDLSSDLRFTHQLLQEYFASEVLEALLDAGVDARTIWQPDRWWEPTGREETAIILAGVRGDVTGVVEWLMDAQPELAAQGITRSGAPAPADALLLKLRAAWTPRLTNRQTDPNPLARAAVGRALGQLTLSSGIPLDNRPGVGVVILPSPREAVGEGSGVRALPDIVWCDPIEPGVYPLGSAEEDDYNPPRDYELTYRYQLAKYPVTYAQFQSFIDDPAGYHDPDGRWWQGLDQAGMEPGHHDAPGEPWFKYANHPRENVSWFEAVAFCRWLSWRFGGPYELNEVMQWKVRLPTEQEWEIAARGQEGRIYPWGRDFDPLKCNASVGDSRVGMTSPVGMYPAGAAPSGALDLAGNMSEWCLTDYQSGKSEIIMKSERVLRGGSWLNGNPAYFRCAYRDGNSPRVRGAFGGGGRLARSLLVSES